MDTRTVILVIVLGIALTACMGPQVQRGDGVLVTYTGRYADNGTVFDSNDPAQSTDPNATVARFAPFAITIGNKQAIAGFENAIIGMRKGETKKNVTIKAVDAYGGYDAAKTVTLQKALVVPLVAHVNRTIVLPVERMPAALRDATAVGKNITAGSILYTIKGMNDTDVVLFILGTKESTIMLDGFTWNSTLVNTSATQLTFRHLILVGNRYDTPEGPFMAVGENATHAMLNTTISLGQVFRTTSGVGRAARETANTITVDFNHPLAGYDLSFDITVDEIIPKK